MIYSVMSYPIQKKIKIERIIKVFVSTKLTRINTSLYKHFDMNRNYITNIDDKYFDLTLCTVCLFEIPPFRTEKLLLLLVLKQPVYDRLVNNMGCLCRNS